MSKRYLHIWHYLWNLQPWYFIGLAVIFGVISLVSLRHNNEHMVRLRDVVYAADQNNGDVEGALRNLRSYIYNHMNTSLASGPNAVHPPIQLKYTYERLVQAQQASIGQGSALYNEAQSYCEGQTKIGSEVISCIQDYISSHGGKVATIPDGLYKFDFTSAKWSPDLAGWSLLAAIFFGACAILSSLYHWFIRRFFLDLD